MKRSRACANLMALESSWNSASKSSVAPASANTIANSCGASAFMNPPLKKKQKAFQTESSSTGSCHLDQLEREMWRPTMHLRNYFLSQEIERALALNNPAEDEEQEVVDAPVLKALHTSTVPESSSIVKHKPCFALEPLSVTHTLEFEFELDLPSLLLLSLSSPK